ncbi:MAG: OmpL47-type beta-barrel domain-containing protein [Thermoplasmata archaeon]
MKWDEVKRGVAAVIVVSLAIMMTSPQAYQHGDLMSESLPPAGVHPDDVVHSLKAPTITLNGPPNNTNFTQGALNIILNATFSDEDDEAMTIRFLADESLNISEAHRLVYRETNVASGTTSTYDLDSLPITPNPSTVLLLHFDGRSEYGENDTIVYDSSGNGNNGTVYGGAIFDQTGGKFAGAFKYDRVDDYVEVAHSPEFNSADRSVEAWINPDLSGHIGYIAGRVGWGNNETYLRVQYSWGYIHAWVGNRTIQPIVSYELPAGTHVGVWHHVAATYDNQTLRLYVDGQERDNATVVNGVSDLDRPWTIGKANYWFGDFFNGTIDEVAVYSRALSAQEIKDHYRLRQGTYYWHVRASDGINEVQSETRQFFVDSGLYRVRLTHPGHQVVNTTTNAAYEIVVTNDGNVSDNFTLTVDNVDNASMAELTQTSITDLGPGSSTNVTLTVGDADLGKYTVVVTVTSDRILGSEDSISIVTNVVLDTFVLGTYLICEQWQALCDYTLGVEKIKGVGGSAVLISVGSGVALWPSEYLPKPEWMPDDHIREVVDYAHTQGLKVYAWLAMPNSYWLNESRHPEWIQILSNGTPADYWPIIPPSRVLGAPEYLAQLKGLMGELVDLGFDGIDINDDFQFLYDASFDNFTVNKFENETNVSVPGDTIPERAQFTKDNQTLLDMWYVWRAGQVTELLSLLQQYIRDAGSDIPLRPHLMSHPWVYWDNGYDWEGIAEAVDAPYLMLGFGEEGIKTAIGWLRDAGARRIVTSLYLYDVEIGDEGWFGQNISWVKEAGASEVFLFTYALAEDKNLWQTIRDAVDTVNQGSIPNITVGQPQYGTSPTYVTSSTEFNLSGEDVDKGLASIWYRIDLDAWTLYAGNFTVSSAGEHTIRYYGTSYLGHDVPIQSYDILVDDEVPTSMLEVGQPQYGASPTYVNASTEFSLTTVDGGAGVASIWYRIDSGAWTEYAGNFTVDGVGVHTIDYYAIDNVGNTEVIQSFEVVVDDDAPTSILAIGEPRYGFSPTYVTSSTEFSLSAADAGAGVMSIWYRIDSGAWTEYAGNFTVDGVGVHTIDYYAVDRLGHRGFTASYNAFVDDYSPTVSVAPDPTTSGTLEIEPGQTISLSASDLGVGGEIIYYSLDDGGTWHQYVGPIEVREDVTILYYAIDALGNRGTEQRLDVVVVGDETAAWGDAVVTGAIFGIAATILIIAVVLVVRRNRRGE